MQALGRHLLLELFDCDAEAINSLDTVKASMVEAAKRAQATIVDVVFHEFNPFGISGVVVIAESHLAIHTWPEYRYAAVDVFSVEPLPVEHPFRKLDNLVLTPHLGYVTEDSFRTHYQQMVAGIDAWFKGEPKQRLA